MNQLKTTLCQRTSRASAMKPDVRYKLTSVAAPRRDQCSMCPFSRPGEMQWEGLHDMVQAVHQELISPEGALKTLKPYFRSNLPTVILKMLTIADTLVRNFGERIFAAMLTEKWPSRIARLTAHSDNKVKHAALQLISNYAQSHSGTPFGETFGDISVSLTTKGFSLPVASSSRRNIGKKSIDSANVDEAFLRGDDFLKYQYPDSESSEGCHTDEEDAAQPDELSLTIQRINVDIAKLTDAISQCHSVARTFRLGGCSRKEILDRLNMAWVVAEKCHVWSENMQAFLTKDLAQDELTALLRTNDELNEGLRSWEGLVSMDIVNSGSSDSESQLSSDFKKWDLTDRHVSDSAIEGKASPTEAVERLRLENEELRQSLFDSRASQQRGMLKAEAEYRSSIKDVKCKAATRIKELLSQVAELELREKQLKREAKDALFRLRIADQALLDKREENGRLEVEAADIRKSQEQRVEEARLCQKELEAQLQEKTAEAAELIVQLANRQEELESLQAHARAEAASYCAQIDQLSRQLERVQREAEQVRIEEYEQDLASLKLELKRESILRKKAFNHIREMKGNIRVLARIRPLATDKPGDTSTIRLHDDYTLEQLMRPSASLGGRRDSEDAVKRYEFDACFGPGASQAEVYSETHELIQSARDGYNVCIFCYGQTGSGKTHTLTGQGKDPGIVPRFMDDVFKSDSAVHQTSLSCYMLELYQDDLLDLLSPTSTKNKMSIRTDAETGMVSVKGATHVDVRDTAELKSTFDAGLSRRKTATTHCNINSSRSHLIFTVLLERLNVITGSQSRSKITFVDLAGSERVVKSGAVNDKERLNEAKAINKSLSALGDVVSALTSRESFVPYRNHKLTELMRDSLDARETQNSLEYAQRAKQVTNENSKSYETRETAKLRAVNEKQAREIQHLRSLVARSN